ncbi:hypothetical protein [Glaciihabitans sp. INWT7]|uniref:hypothetical protein n=1 Tax=Glaciihabitans sp. INWT7 TaxID=2596912 RepID=UPI001626C732|nr:hypothetical protein [Glaciihabitans sp. INWT7]
MKKTTIGLFALGAAVLIALVIIIVVLVNGQNAAKQAAKDQECAQYPTGSVSYFLCIDN